MWEMSLAIFIGIIGASLGVALIQMAYEGFRAEITKKEKK